MNEKALKTLEYYKITDKLAGYAVSEPAKIMCTKLRPSGNREWVDDALLETDGAVARLLRDDDISFNDNKDIRGLVKSASIGHTLTAGELLSVAKLLTLTSSLSAYGEPKEDEEGDALTKYFERLMPLPLLEKEITRCITPEEEVADNASDTLASIRKDRKIISGRIHSHMTSMLNGLRTYLQDGVITMRDNRYCLPVKAEYKSQVPGIIHDQSSTGSTYFIEPQAIVTMNNELKTLELKERDEIEIILSGLTARVAAQGDVLTENQKTITLLDFIYAKAKFAVKTGATKPLFNDRHFINLRQARHPLLDPKTAVPITIGLGDKYDLLIVTGPNTGGKTVSLKTVGLLTLMGQSGLFIPALDRSELGFFTEVYADIGDEQSIEQSLSTFSSHMTSIVSILKNADADSLCLFDELCAGTDPNEGAALAISILSSLHDKGVHTMATTHYSELKIFALSTDHVENASCEFDVETLRPTYRILTGIPGKSNAFAISRKLGLGEDIIEKAKETISSEQESFENVISDLEEKRINIEKDKENIESYKVEIESLKKELDEKKQKLSDQREKIINEAKEEAREILKEAKDVADETIRAFQKQGTVMKIQTMEQKRSMLRDKISKNEVREKKKKAEPVAGRKLDENSAKVGMNVHIVSLNLDGTIKTRPDSKGNIMVQCGAISSKVKLTDVYEIDAPVEDTNVKKPGGGKLNISKSSNIPTEINVIGMTVDEAIPRVDKYLDDAYLCHMTKVRIVHGKGTGALKNGIHSYLRSHPYVSSFELAAHGEGDAGVTVVTF